eukprot:634978-Alexandrium_andersonii.AAC.1
MKSAPGLWYQLSAAVRSWQNRRGRPRRGPRGTSRRATDLTRAGRGLGTSVSYTHLTLPTIC